MIKIKQGLDLPISGSPEQTITEGRAVRSVAVIGSDYVGMKPTMAISAGDRVKKGQLLFTDKKTPGVRYTAPASGTVAAVNRGEKRVLQSVMIDIDGNEEETFTAYKTEELAGLTAEQVQENLNESGLWTALRTRPFSKVPELGSRPNSVFVTAIDTHPLAANPEVVIAEHKEAFETGITVLGKLSGGKIFLCKAPGARIPAGIATAEEFDGPHPAGLAGTHIHFLDPVSTAKTVWTINYQDVIAVGKLFTTGKLFTDRVVALAGPQVEKPRLVRTRLGANTDELTAGEMKAGTNRVISGSVFGGRTAEGAFAFLGRYHNQLSVLENSDERLFLGWANPTVKRHSVLKVLLGRKKLDFTTTTNGGERAMVPVGQYEKVMPLDVLATQLLRAIVVGDTEQAQKLGVLEMDEEDLSLCSYVCAGKYEYGPILRDNLTRIEVEG
ncbi:Na(+)-translocating NADH-quinone reductase subunit A [Endozoicomonas montiporae]|uniref:Na(+)-translocating NADH-quinone reductase subunit A n=2 Tax=Endozoicomonas montiporae TaxID=1027273 RepID=A0A081NA43_9GAMM|nr:Na(+)-translocating NADH-quinone reductase subunit A [Endozoicomonas montiporae]AMO57005.1 Na(+)-translocating NADH-quinone reductase subunit A [Endozoicomonas montiporae CL-33]KEQ15316.1 Na(+)-translocating NADH-quinone reductase subunit A [Endozoicomonas montiporae]